MEVTSKPFGYHHNRPVQLFTLVGTNGFNVQVTGIGASLVSVQVPLPGEAKPTREIALGFDTAEEYSVNPPFFGVTVGPVANRISGAAFELNGTTYELEANQGENCLHSGPECSFAFKLFEPTVYESQDAVGVVFEYFRPDGEGGFPGNLKVQASYWLTKENHLIIHHKAETDAPTPANLTNHGYWNLNGEGSGLVLDHSAQIFADSFLPVTEDLIPTGEVLSVESNMGEMDFRTPKTFGSQMDDTDFGYDHCYILQKTTPSYSWADLGAHVPGPLESISRSQTDLHLAAVTKGTDLTMEIYTNTLAAQLYTGNSLKGVIGRNGIAHMPQTAFCFETAGYNNAINIPEFPSWILEPGQVKEQTTIHTFGW